MVRPSPGFKKLASARIHRVASKAGGECWAQRLSYGTRPGHHGPSFAHLGWTFGLTARHRPRCRAQVSCLVIVAGDAASLSQRVAAPREGAVSRCSTAERAKPGNVRQNLSGCSATAAPVDSCALLRLKYRDNGVQDPILNILCKADGKCRGGCVGAGCGPEQPDRVAGEETMPADGHAIPFIALQDGKFNVTDEAAEFLKAVSRPTRSRPPTHPRQLYMLAFPTAEPSIFVFGARGFFADG